MEVLDLFSVQASMCIYIRRPPLVGGHQAARDCVAITVFQSILLSSLQLPVCQSGILTYSCLPVCYSVLWLFGDQQSGVGYCLLDPGDKG